MAHSRRSILELIASAGGVDIISTSPPRELTEKASALKTSEVNTKSEDANGTSQPMPTLDFHDQESPGGSIIVATVRLTDPGFVVILQDDESAIIGVSEYLTPGQYDDLEIVLDRPLFESEKLTAIIQLDTNENQTFDATRVKPECSQRDEEGTLVSDTATVTLPQFPNAAINFEDQRADDSVVITSATLPENGWIVVAVGEDDDPRFGETRVVGRTDFLKPGRYENIEIPLDEFPKPADCEERMEALLIRDTNDNQEYEFDYHFPQQDVPYVPSGVDTAVVSYNSCS